MKLRNLQHGNSEFDFPFQNSVAVPAQSAGASASFEMPILTVPKSAAQGVKVGGVRITTGAAVSPSSLTVAATLFINWFRAGVRIAQDGAVGALQFTKVATGAAQKFYDLGTLLGVPWNGYSSGAVTAASSTTMTLVATGSHSLSAGMLEVTATLNGGTMYLTIDPFTSNAETVPVTGYVSGTGVATLASNYNGATGTFVLSHSAGAQVILTGPNHLWQGTTSAVTLNSSTGGTLTALSPSLLTTLITGTSTLIFEPGTTNQETVPIQSLNTSTGVFVVAASYNGGKFAASHASGASVCVSGTPKKLIPGDVLTVKWVQSATTGLALPASLVEVNIKLAGTN